MMPRYSSMNKRSEKGFLFRIHTHKRDQHSFVCAPTWKDADHITHNFIHVYPRIKIGKLDMCCQETWRFVQSLPYAEVVINCWLSCVAPIIGKVLTVHVNVLDSLEKLGRLVQTDYLRQTQQFNPKLEQIGHDRGICSQAAG